MHVSWDDLGRPDRAGDYRFQDREIHVNQRAIGIWNEHPTAVFVVVEFEPLNGPKSYSLGGFEVHRLVQPQGMYDRVLDYLRRTFPSLRFELIGDGLDVSARNPNSLRREPELQIEIEGDNFRATTTSASTANPDFGETELLGSPQELEQYIQRFFDPLMPPGTPNRQVIDERVATIEIRLTKNPRRRAARAGYTSTTTLLRPSQERRRCIRKWYDASSPLRRQCPLCRRSAPGLATTTHQNQLS